MDRLLKLAGSIMGNIISTLSIIIALVAGWNDMTNAIARNTVRIESQQQLIQQTSTELRQLRTDIAKDLNAIGAQIHNHNKNNKMPHAWWKNKNSREQPHWE